MLLSLTASLILLPVQQFKDKASLMYTGVPRSSSNAAVQMVTHGVNVTLQKSEYQLESLTFLKNISQDPAEITVTVPVESFDPDWNMTLHSPIQVWVDGKAPQLASTTTVVPIGDQQKKASGIRAESYTTLYTFKLPFAAREAHSIKISFHTPLGHAGLDGAQRVVAYDESGATSWNGGVGQLNFAVHYTPKLVFQVFTALPPDGWELSSMGAFIKQKNISPSANSKLVFTYYPGGYENIGR